MKVAAEQLHPNESKEVHDQKSDNAQVEERDN